AILEAKHVIAHDGVTAGLLPQLARVERREIELLPDPVHLLADDRRDLVQRALPQREVAVDARAELADVTCTKQELMTGDLSVGRSLTQGRNEELGPTVHV